MALNPLFLLVQEHLKNAFSDLPLECISIMDKSSP